MTTTSSNGKIDIYVQKESDNGERVGDGWMGGKRSSIFRYICGGKQGFLQLRYWLVG